MGRVLAKPDTARNGVERRLDHHWTSRNILYSRAFLNGIVGGGNIVFLTSSVSWNREHLIILETGRTAWAARR